MTLRLALASHDLKCLGDPSAVVPVPIGTDRQGRIASLALQQRGVFANLVEFPAVAVGSARFRMQVMATHSPDQILTAARMVAESIQEAKDWFASDMDLNHAVVSVDR